LCSAPSYASINLGVYVVIPRAIVNHSGPFWRVQQNRWYYTTDSVRFRVLNVYMNPGDTRLYSDGALLPDSATLWVNELAFAFGVDIPILC
jgi:hypothetical protein